MQYMYLTDTCRVLTPLPNNYNQVELRRFRTSKGKTYHYALHPMNLVRDHYSLNKLKMATMQIAFASVETPFISHFPYCPTGQGNDRMHIKSIFSQLKTPEWNNSSISKHTRFDVYQAIVLSTLMYGAQTYRFTLSEHGF